MDESVFGVILDRKNAKVLLIKRRDVPVWVLPGGGIEVGESPEKAAKRELEEELGCTVSIVRKVGEYSPKNPLTRFTHVYECEIMIGSPKKGPETRDWGFFSLDCLPKLIPPPYPDWIADAQIQTNQLIKKQITSVNYLVIFKSILLHPILSFRFFITKVGITINTKD